MKTTRDELPYMSEKSRKDPRVVQLYLDHDYLAAYAKHTDLRVAENGYRAAVGNAEHWERLGRQQFDFLKSQGLQRESTLLEVGCGTGRLARKAVPYLQPRAYVGVDISPGAIAAARDLSQEEGWASYLPTFTTEIERLTARFDFAWAFSVFVHLPISEVLASMTAVRRLLAPSGCFLFSYVANERDERTGLKQWRHTERTIIETARAAGLSFERVKEWPGDQRMARGRAEV